VQLLGPDLTQAMVAFQRFSEDLQVDFLVE
jgi:hypothetical protein